MKKRILAIVCVLAMLTSFAACGKNDSNDETTGAETSSEATGKVETFTSEYEIKGTTSQGAPKNDTFIFDGKTTDGIITELTFDIIRNKDTDSEYSKKDIMGYLMNVSDATIEKTENGYKLTKFTSNGYDADFGDGSNSQFMVSGSADEINDETTFKDITILDLVIGKELELDMALIAFKGVAKEAGITDFSGDTLIKDLLSAYGLYADGSFTEGTNRISFEGANGGRSYGEQIDAIVAHILASDMTLEDVYEMFKTTNQGDTAIMDRDAVSGATIAFTGDFARTVYLAIYGELFEGVTGHNTTDEGTTVTVLTQGFGGEITTKVTFDTKGKIAAIAISNASETPDIGGKLTAEDSDFIKSIIASQDSLDSVDATAGATVTSNALISAVKFATEYFAAL